MNFLKYSFSFLPFFLLECNYKSEVNSYSLIIDIDSLEFYKHPLKNKKDLKLFARSEFNIKNFIKEYDIKKEDTILIKMIESGNCVPNGLNLQHLLKNENLKNVSLKKFDDKDDSILGYKNFILFDTTRHIQLVAPQSE